ncbi:MAG: serine/threonine-protein kinase, partial [Acidimicrobiales bacterium]
MGIDRVMAPAGELPPPLGFEMLAGRYEVGGVLGRGGMGEVRAGLDQRLGRPVAIKILRADMAHDPVIRQRFEEEGRMAARLVHPHVVAVFDTGEEHRVPYLVMERLSGRTLADTIVAAGAGGPLDVGEVRDMGAQVLDALAAAHAAGMVHRDVKPGNVMAAGPGTWKVGDFGIAKSLEVSAQNHTTTGLIIGTLAYLAPERLAGGPASVSSDIYSAGVVLYEALTGRRPVEEGAPVHALLTAVPVPIAVLRPDVPAELAEVVARAMERDPHARFATAADMAGALRSANLDDPNRHTAQAPTVVHGVVGAPVGAPVGTTVGAPVGTTVGVPVGTTVGATVGTTVGAPWRSLDPRHR